MCKTSFLFTCLILLPVPGSPASNHLTWVVFVLVQFILHLSPEKVQTLYTVFLFIESHSLISDVTEVLES